jgi:hypothetical protein
MRALVPAFLVALSGLAQDPPPEKAPAKPPANQDVKAPEKIPELRELRVRLRHLVARAVAVKSLLKNVEDNLAQRGFALNGDLVAMRTRVDEFLDDADQDLKDGRRADLLEDLNHAEGSLQRLERMIGTR